MPIVKLLRHFREVGEDHEWIDDNKEGHSHLYELRGIQHDKKWQGILLKIMSPALTLHVLFEGGEQNREIGAPGAFVRCHGITDR